MIIQAREYIKREIAKGYLLFFIISAAESQADVGAGEGNFQRAYESAMESLPSPGSSISQESFGKFIAWARAACIMLLRTLPRAEASETKRRVRELLISSGASSASSGSIQPEEVLHGREIEVKNYQSLAGLLAKVAEDVGGNRQLLEMIAKVLELLDIALLIEKTTGVERKEEMLVEIARFFDTTLNSHIFDCLPYHIILPLPILYLIAHKQASARGKQQNCFW